MTKHNLYRDFGDLIRNMIFENHVPDWHEIQSYKLWLTEMSEIFVGTSPTDLVAEVYGTFLRIEEGKSLDVFWHCDALPSGVRPGDLVHLRHRPSGTIVGQARIEKDPDTVYTIDPDPGQSCPVTIEYASDIDIVFDNPDPS